MTDISGTLGTAIGIGMLAIVLVSVLDILKDRRGEWLTQSEIEKEAKKKGGRLKEDELDEMVAKGKIKAKKVGKTVYYMAK